MVTLRFSLSPEAVARLHDMLSCLTKFSDTVSFEARKDHISISALNSSKSGYASFSLGSKFFSAFKFVPDGNGRDPKFTCSILNKALLSVFRARIDTKSRDTAISRCEVNVQDSDEQAECRLIVKMICAHGVTKVYQLTYEATEVVHALFDRNTATNHWTTQAVGLREFSEYFGPKAEQLDIYLEEGKVTFLSFTDKIVSSKNEVLRNPLRTAVSISTDVFDEFDAEEGLHIVFSVKDFKSIVSHAASVHAALSAHYSRPGRPLQFTYTHEGATANFTLMTAGDYGDTPAPTPDMSRTVSRAASMAASATTTTGPVQAEISGEMLPPAKPEPRRSNRRLGQNESGATSSKAREDSDSLFVPAAADEEEDSRWDPPEWENDGESMGWDASVRNDTGFQPTFRDTQSMSRSHSMEEPPQEGLPPTQRISQIRGLW